MWKFKQLTASRPWQYGCATAGLLVGMVMMHVLTAPEPLPSIEILSAEVIEPATKEITVISPLALERADEEFVWARRQAEVRLDEHFKPVDELFEQVRCREFAETVLGWESKWLILKSKFVPSEEHERMIERAFKTYIFDEVELERLLRQSTHAYIREIDNIDSELLVRLSLDLANLPEGEMPAFDAKALKLSYADLLQRAVEASRADVMATVKREVASYVVQEALTAALIKLGVSTGFLAAGATSTWTTFGAGIVIGLLVDYAIQQYTDPVGHLADDLDDELALLQFVILNGRLGMGGEQGDEGLFVLLSRYAEARGVARQCAVEQLLKEFATRRVTIPMNL